MNLFDYTAELEASQILTSLYDEIESNIRLEKSFRAASNACETLCDIAQTPNHYLGLELMRVLDDPLRQKIIDVGPMILAFLTNIHSHIEYQRSVASASRSPKPVHT